MRTVGALDRVDRRDLRLGPMSAASTHRRASRRRPRTSGRPRPPWFQPDRTFGTRSTAIESSRSRFELQEQHAVVLAVRAAGPLDGRGARRRYRLKFGHGVRIRLGASELAPTGQSDPASAEPEHGTKGPWSRGQNCSISKTSSAKMNAPDRDPGYCDSNGA
jgi:hypothetical protein